MRFADYSQNWFVAALSPLFLYEGDTVVLSWSATSAASVTGAAVLVRPLRDDRYEFLAAALRTETPFSFVKGIVNEGPIRVGAAASPAEMQLEQIPWPAEDLSVYARACVAYLREPLTFATGESVFAWFTAEGKVKGIYHPFDPTSPAARDYNDSVAFTAVTKTYVR